jgi:hypothetical protein
MTAYAQNNESGCDHAVSVFDHYDRIPERLTTKIEHLHQRLTGRETRGRS